MLAMRSTWRTARRSKFDFKDITIGPDGASVEEPEPHRPDWSRIQMLARFGAAARAPVRRTLAARFASPPDVRSAPQLRAAVVGRRR